MSVSLKFLPCPAGNNCTAFQCIFGHERDNSPTVPSTPPVENATSHVRRDREASGADQDGPRKRLRTDSGTSAPSIEKPDRDDGGHSGATPKISSKGSSDELSVPVVKKLKTATRAVSPPPLKRCAPSSETPEKSRASLTPKSAASGQNHKSTPSQKPAPATKPKKAESLNPRLLKNSPASHEIRLKLLKMLYQEFMRLNTELKKNAKDGDKKFFLSEQDLVVRALNEEEHIAVHKSSVYSNVMKNKVMQYKRMKVADWRKERVEERNREIQKKQPQDDTSGKPLKIVTGLTPAQEVQLAKRVLTDVRKLGEHGYVSVVPSEESIQQAKLAEETSKGWEKCDRCQQRFQVFPGRRQEDGALTSGGTCTFHWGKTYIAPKAAWDMARQPKRYQCCGQEVGDSVGCFSRDHHVFKTTDPKRLASVLNFAKTPENPSAPKDRAVAFDCEMGYTVYGLELIRLTATSWPTGETLLDVLVRPLGEILDLNSRYSGVWPDDLANAEPWSADIDSKPTKSGSEYGSEDGEAKPPKKELKIVSSPEVARDLLFSLISPSTPLIGHGLENDLNSVRIVHPTLIDTVLLYPHKAGLPYRYGLKMLMDVHLGRKIQQETGPKMLGHDSAEDARAAGDLVRLKVRNEWMDMQRAGWRLLDGEFAEPGKKTKRVPGEASGNLTAEFIEG